MAGIVIMARASVCALCNGKPKNVIMARVQPQRTRNLLRATIAESGRVKVAQRVQDLATLLKDRKLDAMIIPSDDPHMSEIPPDCFARRQAISGFTGSAGTAVVLANGRCALATDGRYFLQADEQLDKNKWELLKVGVYGQPTADEWLTTKLGKGSKVAIDPFVHSKESTLNTKKILREAGIELEFLEDGKNLVDMVWDDRPQMPMGSLRIHPQMWSGQSVGEKITKMRESISDLGADALLVTMLDDVAWLFNVRGSDVPNTPVPLAYGIIHKNYAKVYVEKSKLPQEVVDHFKEAKVIVMAYEAVSEDLRTMAADGCKIAIDPSRTVVGLINVIQKGEAIHKAKQMEIRGTSTVVPAIIETQSPVVTAKAIKSAEEIRGMEEAHLKDAVALVELFHWLECELSAKGQVYETEIADMAYQLRSKQDDFLSNSFDAIAGSGPNGAVIHYRAIKGSDRQLQAGEMFLLDSGGQYIEGTTDVTRTMFLGGSPPIEQKQAFTAVLKGHIGIDQLTFPEGTPGCAIDVIARQHLWQLGLDYRHGTSHGVGAALNVHEGPQSISPRFGNLTGLLPGMIISNEPGYYKEGEYGIRIENLLVIEERKTENQFGERSYLGFRSITFVPIQRALIEFDMLTESERKWIDDYHDKVREKVLPRIAKKEVRDWLIRNTQPLSSDLCSK